MAGDEAITLDDDGVQGVIKAQVKRRLDAAEAFAAGGRTDRADDERSEIAILEEYLPAALSDEDLETVVREVFEANGFATQADMGAAMKAVNAVVAGRGDGRKVAEMVKSRLV